MFNYIKNDYKAKSFIFFKSAYRGSEKKKKNNTTMMSNY